MRSLRHSGAQGLFSAVDRRYGVRVNPNSNRPGPATETRKRPACRATPLSTEIVVGRLRKSQQIIYGDLSRCALLSAIAVEVNSAARGK